MPDAPAARPTFADFIERLRALRFTERFDAVVAIANGGCVPGALLAERFQIPLEILHLNWRGPDNTPCRETPTLLRAPSFSFAGKALLIADDRSKTGATLEAARRILREAALLRTFAVNGTADYSLYNTTCFPMPWR
ncbi:MAG: phosphoribosyltransferase [Opitutaceae bacterium]|jgi:xanthine phosphoribosyltransferase|nr:phosphoribosyltransferase [Opitutaceae bacterium]